MTVKDFDKSARWAITFILNLFYYFHSNHFYLHIFIYFTKCLTGNKLRLRNSSEVTFTKKESKLHDFLNPNTVLRRSTRSPFPVSNFITAN